MALPADIQQIINAALTSVQNHPKGELAQAYRRQIYDSLWEQYFDVCAWLAIISARQVQSLYENKWREVITFIYDVKNLDDVDFRSMIRSLANGDLYPENLYYLKPDSQQEYAKRMLDIAEDVMNGEMSFEYAKSMVTDYYYELMSFDVNYEPRDAFFALYAAYQALITTARNKPLKHQVGDPIGSANGTIDHIHWSSEWNDLELVTHQVADFAAYAAFAFAYVPDTQEYDFEMLKEFWEWWLRDAIPLAWKTAGKK